MLWVWFLQHWIANNLFGLAFALNGVEFLQLNRISTGCILLGGLFVYDIFWVSWALAWLIMFFVVLLLDVVVGKCNWMKHSRNHVLDGDLCSKWAVYICTLFDSCSNHYRCNSWTVWLPTYLCFNEVFQVILDYPTPPRFPSSTCSGREPLEISLHRPDALPVIQLQSTEWNSKHWINQWHGLIFSLSKERNIGPFCWFCGIVTQLTNHVKLQLNTRYLSLQIRCVL